MDEKIVQCPHKRGCKCLEKALELARSSGKDVIVQTGAGSLRIIKNEKEKAT